jgi:hypothetical protein
MAMSEGLGAGGLPKVLNDYCIIARRKAIFTGVDGFDASILDKTEGPDNTKLQCEVQFVEAVKKILPEAWQVRQERQRIQDRLAREERLAKLRR